MSFNRIATALTVTSALLALAPAARAQSLASLEAKFEPAPKGKGQVLHVRGVAKKLPDQTRLIIKLFVKGDKDAIQYWEIGVANGAYESSIYLEGREPAPLVYRAELWLMLPKQLPPIRKQLQRDFGLSETHDEVLDGADIEVGTKEERAKFERDTLKVVDEVCRKALDEYAALDAAQASPPADWKKQKDEITKRLKALQELYNSRGRKYLTLGEPSMIGLASRVVGQALQAMNAIGTAKAEDARAAIDAGRQAADRLRGDLDARLSKDEDKKDDKAGGQGENKAGGSPSPDEPKKER
jgi:hypothetical protein